MNLRALTEGRGTLTTIALLHEVEAPLLRGLLPAGLTLPDAHPARLLVLQSRCQFRAWFGDMRYHELAFGIPDVASPDVPRCLYLRRLYLDAALPRWLGNLIYGFEKLPAHLSWEGTSAWRAARPDGAPILQADWEELPHDADASALFAALAQPVVSQAARRRHTAAAITHGGPFLYTRLHTPAPATLRRVVGDVDLGPGLDPPALSGVQLRRAAAFLVETTQVVSLPARRP
jgi:hypothetical protein